MKTLRELNAGELTWMQPRALERAFELRAGEEVVGTLLWKRSFGSLADAVAAEGKWTFKRVGFFSPQITVRAAEADTNLAVFVPNWKAEGMLRFGTGREFRWAGTGFWRTHWSFSETDGEPLLEFAPHSSFLKSSGSVKATPKGREITELPLLLLLGWYLIVLRSDDDAAAAAVICST